MEKSLEDSHIENEKKCNNRIRIVIPTAVPMGISHCSSRSESFFGETSFSLSKRLDCNWRDPLPFFTLPQPLSSLTSFPLHKRSYECKFAVNVSTNVQFQAKAICEKHPNIKNVCVLAQLLLEEEEQSKAERESKKSGGEDHQSVVQGSDTSPDPGILSGDIENIAGISDQHEDAMMANSSDNQVERCPQGHLTHSDSDISLDLISFTVPACTPPQVLNGYVNDAHLGDNSPDLIEL